MGSDERANERMGGALCAGRPDSIGTGSIGRRYQERAEIKYYSNTHIVNTAEIDGKTQLGGRHFHRSIGPSSRGASIDEVHRRTARCRGQAAEGVV